MFTVCFSQKPIAEFEVQLPISYKLSNTNQRLGNSSYNHILRKLNLVIVFLCMQNPEANSNKDGINEQLLLTKTMPANWNHTIFSF